MKKKQPHFVPYIPYTKPEARICCLCAMASVIAKSDNYDCSHWEMACIVYHAFDTESNSQFKPVCDMVGLSLETYQRLLGVCTTYFPY